MERVDVYDNKYSVIWGGDPFQSVQILRYGEEWLGPDFPGSNAVLALACDLQEARARIAELEEELKVASST